MNRRSDLILKNSLETGVLLHPTSLPGAEVRGKLGRQAFEFLSWLSDSGAGVWQILPLSPPVFGLSPYQGLSSFAINPVLISTELLTEWGFLHGSHHHESRFIQLETAAKTALLDPPEHYGDFSGLPWVREWGLFMAAREKNRDRPWTEWSSRSTSEHERADIHRMIQFFAQIQWDRVRRHAARLGIRILGDLPIYTAHDSADVFFNREIFKLAESGRPAKVAGVPPDYFSKTGQLWGNPVYDWEASSATEHRWWTSRMARAMELYDMVRVDHFRGFESCWEVEAGAGTAVQGKWMPGPGKPFFDHLRERLGELPLVAEDLGIITPSVTELRKQCGFPGMTVLQFALQDPSFSVDSVPFESLLYTGTHDNDTAAGWIESTGRSLGYTSPSQLVDMALGSKAGLAVIPMQDVLGLDSSARMNTPATRKGNWRWRLKGLPEPANLNR